MRCEVQLLLFLGPLVMLMRAHTLSRFRARCRDYHRLNMKPSVAFECASEESIESLGATLGMISKKADVVLLRGDLGVGKTCFARGFIRAKVDESDLRVTSPSYLLDNTVTRPCDVHMHLSHAYVCNMHT